MRIPQDRLTEPSDCMHAPYPELVERGPHAGPWKVLDSRTQDWLASSGATIKVDRTLFVPFEAGGLPVCMHELAHVAWSPDRFPRVRYPLVVLQAVEDARINQGLSRVGLTILLDHEAAAHVGHLTAQDAKHGRVAAVLLRAIASLSTSAETMMRAEVDMLSPRAREIALDWLERTDARLSLASAAAGGPVAPFRVARDVARDLAGELRRYGLLEDDLRVRDATCCYVPEGTEVGAGLGLGDRARRLLERRLGRRGDGDGEAGTVEPGELTITRPPLRVRQRAAAPARFGAMRPACEGGVIRRPDRLLIDRAIFARRGRDVGGSVLVDASGSMSLSVEQLEQIVTAACGTALVAIYSGADDAGELRIVADRGWRVAEDDLAPNGSGNIVDLPALEWLARQPEPRFWVSDGGVTGVGDTGCGRLRERCMALARRAGIKRVDDADAALEALSASLDSPYTPRG